MYSNHLIEINPNIMLGKPVVRGTRITVELILRKLGEGATTEELLDAYPRLSENGIHAAMLFAADSIGRQEVFDLTVSETAETAG